MRPIIAASLVFAASLASTGVPSLATDIVVQPTPVQPTHHGWVADIWVGYASLQLPETHFTTVIDTSLDTVRKKQDHDGDVDGVRIGASLFAPLMRDDGRTFDLGLKGFYGSYSSDGRSTCSDADLNVAFPCGWSFLLDTDPATRQKDTTGEQVGRTHRDVDHWGLAIEKQWPSGEYGAYPAVPNRWKFGVAHKSIDQQLDLAIDEIGGDLNWTRYNEELDTDYWGAYFGLIAERPLGSGWFAMVDLEGGIYFANTEYQGNQQAFSNVGTATFTQSLGLEDDDAAVIASVRGEIGRELSGGARVTLFGEAEYYSYVPRMHYNDQDVNGGDVNLGIETATRIDDDDAWSYTLGGKLSIPLQNVVASDKRLKRDIKLVARLDDGLNLYAFRYLWGEPVFVGLMAQELLAHESTKGAVVRNQDGFLFVDYAALGLKMTTLHRWQEEGLSALTE